MEIVAQQVVVVCSCTGKFFLLLLFPRRDTKRGEGKQGWVGWTERISLSKWYLLTCDPVPLI